MEYTQIVKAALVCLILACSATVCCQEEEEKQRKRRKISPWKFLLDRNKHGAHVVTVNIFRGNDRSSFFSKIFTNERWAFWGTYVHSFWMQLVPRTSYDLEVIRTLLFFPFIQVLLFQHAKLVNSIQLLTIFEKIPS